MFRNVLSQTKYLIDHALRDSAAAARLAAAFSTGAAAPAARRQGIELVEEDDTRGGSTSALEYAPHRFFAFANELIQKLGAL